MHVHKIGIADDLSRTGQAFHGCDVIAAVEPQRTRFWGAPVLDINHPGSDRLGARTSQGGTMLVWGSEPDVRLFASGFTVPVIVVTSPDERPEWAGPEVTWVRVVQGEPLAVVVEVEHHAGSAEVRVRREV